MNLGKGKARAVVPVVLAAGLVAGAGAAYAATEGFASLVPSTDPAQRAEYEPTTLGNDAYDNHVDLHNDYTVSGVYFTSAISSQNADTVAATRALSVTMGQDGEEAVPIAVTNSLGKTIAGLTYCSSSDTGFPSNMLSGDLADGEAACWFYTYDYAEQDITNRSGVEYVMPENYTLQATFSDGTTAEFHNINMNAVRTINLCYSQDYGVYYVERTTITNHTPDPNLYYEVNRAEALQTGDYTADEFNYHVNSGARMDDLMITASRGGGWDIGVASLPDIEDFGIELPLVGEPDGEYTDGMYENLYWNGDKLEWRKYNND